MQRIERYGVIALVFLLVTILAVSLWGEGQGRAKGILASFRSGGEEVAAADEESPKRRAEAAPTANTAGPRNSPRRSAPLSTPGEADPDGRPKKRGRGKSPEVGAPSTAERTTASPARGLPTPSNVAAGRPQRESTPAVAPERAQLVQRNQPRKTTTASQGRFYVVRSGETLSEIAQRELGTYKRWTEIQALNGGLDPAKLRQGMKLRMPPRDAAAAAERVAEAVQPPKQPAKEPTTEAAPRTVNGQGTYVVKSGDVLGVIAQRELGSSKRWPEIVALNPGLDPDRVPVGTRLRMPEGAARVQQVAVADTRRSTRSQPSATPARPRGKVR